jgi:diguanylate cyclase (GGDEF)-like protein
MPVLPSPTRLLARRPPEALALCALLLGAAAVLVLAVAFPMSEQAPVRLGYAMIGVAVAMAAATLAVGHRVPRDVLLAEAVVAAILNSVLVAYAHTPGGALGDAFAYGWLTAYVAVFFPPAAVGFAVLVATGFGLGLLASGLPGLFTGWALVSLSTLMLAAVISRVSRGVRRQAVTDALTGALNRGGLRIAAERAAARRRRRTQELTVAALDLDAFKQVNDRDGHAGGDRLLAEAVDAWQSVLRGDDVLARTGGDEFVLLMPGTTETEAAAVLERLRRSHPVAWSAGVATWRPGEPLEACLQRADERLYAAKAAATPPAAGTA